MTVRTQRDLAATLVNHLCAREACRQRFVGVLRALYCSDTCRRLAPKPVAAPSIPIPAQTPALLGPLAAADIYPVRKGPARKHGTRPERRNLCALCSCAPATFVPIVICRHPVYVCQPCAEGFEERIPAQNLRVSRYLQKTSDSSTRESL